MRFRKTPFRRRPRPKVDMMEYNLCKFVVASDGEGCQAPAITWNLIVSPSLEPTGQMAPGANRGISFQGARFRYRYFTVDSDPTVAFAAFRFWSALIVAPTNNVGAPLGDGTGALPTLGNVQGDIGYGVRILWRGLDYNVITTTVPLLPPIGDPTRYCPLEHVKAKAFLKEGQGLFFVTEIVAPTEGNIVASSLDLTMSLALRTVI